MASELGEQIVFLTNKFVVVALLCTFVYSVVCYFFRPIKRLKHLYRIRAASNRLETLRSIHEPKKQFGYLRKIDPFTFEELILTALSGFQGFKIKRNERYTGDGGVDGRAVFNGVKLIIQAKRYSGHIHASDVLEFATKCKTHKAKGLFIHTGKTGKKAKEYGRYFNIQIVSGQQFLDFLNGKDSKIRFT